MVRQGGRHRRPERLPPLCPPQPTAMFCGWRAPSLCRHAWVELPCCLPCRPSCSRQLPACYRCAGNAHTCLAARCIVWRLLRQMAGVACARADAEPGWRNPLLCVTFLPKDSRWRRGAGPARGRHGTLTIPSLGCSGCAMPPHAVPAGLPPAGRLPLSRRRLAGRGEVGAGGGQQAGGGCLPGRPRPGRVWAGHLPGVRRGAHPVPAL